MRSRLIVIAEAVFTLKRELPHATPEELPAYSDLKELSRQIKKACLTTLPLFIAESSSPDDRDEIDEDLLTELYDSDLPSFGIHRIRMALSSGEIPTEWFHEEMDDDALYQRIRAAKPHGVGKVYTKMLIQDLRKFFADHPEYTP